MFSRAVCRCLHAEGSARGSVLSLRRRHLSNRGSIGILGVPFEHGGDSPGVGEGVEALRKAGLREALISLGHDVRDYGNIMYEKDSSLVGPENMEKYEYMPPCMYEVSRAATRIQSEGRVCLSIGGDHSMAIGTINATASVHDHVAVLYVDAHADINTPATSHTGNVHGMPLSLHFKELAPYWPDLPGMDWQSPKLSLKNLAYIGLRSVDEYERLIIEKFGVCAFGMDQVERLGIAETVRRALQHIDPEGRRALHVSMDIDALDALEAPSTVLPTRGGLTLREGLHVMEAAHGTGRLAAVDLAEVNPHMGSAADVRTTVDAAIQLLLAACGNSRLGMLPRTRDIPLTPGAAGAARAAGP